MHTFHIIIRPVSTLKEIDVIAGAIAKEFSLIFSLSGCYGIKADFFCQRLFDPYKLRGEADNIKLSSVFALPLRRVINSKISLSLMSLFGHTYAYITSENQLSWNATFLMITSGPAGHMIRRSTAPWQLNVELRIWLIISRFPRVSSTTRSSFFSSVYSSETGKLVLTRQDN